MSPTSFEPAFRDAAGDWHSEGRRKLREVAEKLVVIAHLLGVTPQHISRLKHGKVMPSPILAARIEALLGWIRAFDWGTSPTVPIESKLSVDRPLLRESAGLTTIELSKTPTAA
jgi:DNA-binding XRE family transcriptional regulator